MRAKARRAALAAVLVSLAAAAVGVGLSESRPDLSGAVPIGRVPGIRPDYAGVVMPPNIAPLNFVVREPGERYFVRVKGERGEAVERSSRAPEIAFPLSSWRALLEANRGGSLRVEVFVRQNGRWQQFQPIENRVAQEPIDEYLVYRVVGPIHTQWRNTAIHQRHLAGDDERVVLDGVAFESGCINCHCFQANRADRMTIGVRAPEFGDGTLLVDDGRVEKIGSKFGYSSWHPRAGIVAYSINKVTQFFHTGESEVRDVIDLDAGLAYYRLDTHRAKLVPGAALKDRLETYPTWSPDGRFLYYCSAPILWTDRETVPPERFAEVRYDLMRIAYDAKTDRWGEPETVLAADATGLSILEPRVSPDGRFLLFTMCQYGCFPIYQPSSDLYLMDLADRRYWKPPINSAYSESWHSWSSNARWIAFSSKRLDGLFTRTFLSYVDAEGKAYKPLVVPQADPARYDSMLTTMSVPELIASPVAARRNTLMRAATARNAPRADAISGATTKVDASDPWQGAHE